MSAYFQCKPSNELFGLSKLDLEDSESSETERHNSFSTHDDDNLLMMSQPQEEKAMIIIINDNNDNSSKRRQSSFGSGIKSILRKPHFSGINSNNKTREEKQQQSTSKSSFFTKKKEQGQRKINFGKVAIIEFDKKKASCDTIKIDRWAATRPECNITYARPNIYNPRGSLILFGRHSSASSRPMQPKRRESDAFQSQGSAACCSHQMSPPPKRRESFLTAVFWGGGPLQIPDLTTTDGEPESVNTQQHKQNNKTSSTMPLRLPRRRSSVTQPEDQPEQRPAVDVAPQSRRRRSSAVFAAAAAAMFGKPEDQQQQQGTSVDVAPRARRRRSSAIFVATAAAMPRLPRRRSSCLPPEAVLSAAVAAAKKQ